MTTEQQKKIRWLNRAFHAEKKAKAWLAKLERDRSLAERISRSFSGNGGNASGNSTEDLLIRLADTERETQNKLADLARIRSEITAAIESVQDDDMQSILVRHFLAYETFDIIADRMHYSRPTVMRKYKQALDKMILNDTP